MTTLTRMLGALPLDGEGKRTRRRERPPLRSRGRPGERAVEGDRPLDHAALRVALLVALPPGEPHAAPADGVGQNLHDGLGQRPGLARGYDEPRHAGLD